MTAYQYEPLSPDSIRLLVLQPSASHDAELRGSLLCTTLAEADYDLIDPYTALSYVWGSDERPCLIFLDGKDFAITQSLHDALRDMRDATRARRIWADALCINQGDVPERNAQVKLMGKIYGMAPSTIIYLGQLTADAAKLLSARSWRAAEVHHETLGMDQGAAPAADILAKPMEANALVKPAARDVLSWPWFKRVWVLQELVLSKNLWIQRGRQRVRWDDFCPLLLAEFKLGTATLPDEYQTLMSLLDDMNETRNIRAGGDGKSLCDVLKMRRGFDVADPRDYVYANLSIISDLRRVREYLDVDYGDSVQAVFSRMAVYILDTEGIKGLLAQVQDMHPEERLQGLPSWAPEWQCLAPNLTNHIRDQPKSVLEKYHVLSISGRPSILAHTGYDVGIISSVSAVLPLDRNAANTLLAREQYSYVRQRLLNMYDAILKATGPIDEVDNDYVCMSGNPPVSTRVRLCQALGREWVRFFENLPGS
ncbi:Heterokaryon incompatibility protein 6, OR allele [Colletotrichum viniferum]|nr:Heterokaryon incompatibility protein 6, OR allele [Colletotrichum viniferum]